jgi:hypothetical protein
MASCQRNKASQLLFKTPSYDNNHNNYSLSSNGVCPTVVVVSPVVKAPILPSCTRTCSPA